MQHKNYDLLKAIENYISEYIDENGSSPTVMEIAKGVGSNKPTTARYLAFMREKGIINYSGHRNYSTKESQKTHRQTTKVPVLGSVACGIPKFAEGNIEEYVRLPISIFGKGDFYILRANGDSMIDVGINDGDLVLIRHQNYADEGQIVVALIDDEATLKCFYPEPKNHRIRLHPENKKYDDIFVTQCEVQGVAVKVLKDLE